MKAYKYIFKIVLLISAVLVITSCGTSEIICKKADVDIYVNGINKGKGIVKLKRMGIPRKSVVSARYNNEEIGQITVKRKIDGVTIILGLVTNYTAFLWAWRYPAVIEIPIKNESPVIPSENKSIWMNPPQNNLK